jgi:hypothetical protein
MSLPGVAGASPGASPDAGQQVMGYHPGSIPSMGTIGPAGHPGAHPTGVSGMTPGAMPNMDGMQPAPAHSMDRQMMASTVVDGVIDGGHRRGLSMGSSTGHGGLLQNGGFHSVLQVSICVICDQ